MKKFIFASLGLVLCPTISFAGDCTSTTHVRSTGGDMWNLLYVTPDYMYIGNFSEALACGVTGPKTCNYGQYVMVIGDHRLGCEKCGGKNVREQMDVYRCIDAGGIVDYWEKGHESDISDCSPDQSAKYYIIGEKDGYVYKSSDLSRAINTKYSAGNKNKMCREKSDPVPDKEHCSDGSLVSNSGTPFDCSNSSDSDIKTGEKCKKYCLYDKNKNPSIVEGIIKCPENWELSDKKDLSSYTPSVSENLYKKCVQKKQPKKTCDELYPYAMYPQRNLCCKAGKSTKWVPKNDWVNGRCICVDETEVWDEKTGKCIKNKSCKELYKGNDEAIACCEKKGANWNTELKRCDCEDDDKNWVYDPETKTGECVSGGDVDPVDGCTYYFKGDIICKNNGNSAHMEVKIPITKAMLKAYGKKNCTEMDSTTLMVLLFDDRFSADLKKFKEQYLHLCDDNNNHVIPPAPTGPSKTEVNDATNSMNAFFNSVNANRSVWKTVDGKFNTARLASDLTSAVVLGTVGGVVSSVVIKKKQVEKGFEVLHCKVGGQKIADWGDEFTVGFRK